MFPTCNLQLCNIDLPMVNIGFSYWLREEMQKRDWTQADLMRHSGMSNAQISRVLNESREPGNDFLRAVARAFKVSPEIVFRAAGALSTDQLQDLINAVRPALESADREQVRSALRSFIDHITIDRDEKTILGQIVFYVPDLPDGYAYEKSHRPFPLHTHKFSYTYSSNFRGSFSLTRR